MLSPPYTTGFNGNCDGGGAACGSGYGDDSCTSRIKSVSISEDPTIYSVSFKEGGIEVRKQSKEDFATRFLMPRPRDISQDDEQQQRRRTCERSPIAQSFPAAARSGYRSLDGRKNSAPTIYCIHGNTFGVARCCEELRSPEQLYRSDPENWMDSANAIDISDATPIDPHCHDAEGGGRSGGGMDTTARRKLMIASVLCLVFIIVEAVGGILAGSLAIATDAAHLLTDFASFMISLFSLWVASRPPTTYMSFGWHRAEVIGATVSVLMIWVVTGILVYAACLRIVSGEYEIEATIMLITSAIGVAVNIVMGCALHQGGHGHSHGGGGHGHAHVDGERTNVNVRAAFIHVIGDFVQSLGVFIAALIIYYRPDWKIADPICTFIFSILVLVTTIRILRDTMNVLMEGIPNDISFNVVQEILMSVEGIVAVHNLRIWGLTTDKTALSAHLAIRPEIDEQQILREASTRVRSKYNIFEMTLQVEQFHEDMGDCNKCKPPEK